MCKHDYRHYNNSRLLILLRALFTNNIINFQSFKFRYKPDFPSTYCIEDHTIEMKQTIVNNMIRLCAAYVYNNTIYDKFPRDVVPSYFFAVENRCNAFAVMSVLAVSSVQMLVQYRKTEAATCHHITKSITALQYARCWRLWTSDCPLDERRCGYLAKAVTLSLNGSALFRRANGGGTFRRCSCQPDGPTTRASAVYILHVGTRTKTITVYERSTNNGVRGIYAAADAAAAAVTARIRNAAPTDDNLSARSRQLPFYEQSYRSHSTRCCGRLCCRRYYRPQPLFTT